MTAPRIPFRKMPGGSYMRRLGRVRTTIERDVFRSKGWTWRVEIDGETRERGKAPTLTGAKDRAQAFARNALWVEYCQQRDAGEG